MSFLNLNFFCWESFRNLVDFWGPEGYNRENGRAFEPIKQGIFDELSQNETILSQNETIEYQNYRGDWEQFSNLDNCKVSFIYKLSQDSKLRIKMDSEK